MVARDWDTPSESPYAVLQRGHGQSPPLAALAPPPLPIEVRRPRPTLGAVLGGCTDSQRARIALAVAQELAALHADQTTVGQLDPDAVRFGMTGYPEIMHVGEVRKDSPYTAPELRDERSRSRRPRGTTPSDTYALGALLYRLFTGREPPLCWGPTALAELSPTVAAIVSRCVADDPLERPSSADVATAIEGAGAARLLGGKKKRARGAWNRASVVVLAGSAVVLVLAGAMTTAMGAVGVAAVLGVSITAGATF